ncbi:MAG: hypothetical protein WCJ64_03500 [Rhodospirillaceae bacterium]
MKTTLCSLLAVFAILIPKTSIAEPDKVKYELARECVKDVSDYVAEREKRYTVILSRVHYNAALNKCFAELATYTNNKSITANIVDILERRPIAGYGYDDNKTFFCWALNSKCTKDDEFKALTEHLFSD